MAVPSFAPRGSSLLINFPSQPYGNEVRSAAASSPHDSVFEERSWAIVEDGASALVACQV